MVGWSRSLGPLARTSIRCSTMNHRLRDALAISVEWQSGWRMHDRVAAQLADLDPEWTVDVVALGKASREMAGAVVALLEDRVLRQFIVSHEVGRESSRPSQELVGDHPLPGARSVAAGRALRSFLAGPTSATCTVFCISGGASSLCVDLQPPCTLDDLSALWRAVVTVGEDIGVLNQLRTAASTLAGGLVLRDVRTPHSVALVLVDNVVTGASGVASGLTYDTNTSDEQQLALLQRVGLEGSALAVRLRHAAHARAELLARPVMARHRNRVVADAADLLGEATNDAGRLGYRVVSLGAAVVRDVDEVARDIADALTLGRGDGERVCVLGVGEVGVAVHGDGHGGRCQQLAASMAPLLSTFSEDVAVVARASDGRDHLRGVGGAWADGTTFQRGHDAGIEWSDVLRRRDSNPALAALDQLLPGGPTGWNLCDLYVACV